MLVRQLSCKFSVTIHPAQTMSSSDDEGNIKSCIEKILTTIDNKVQSFGIPWMTGQVDCMTDICIGFQSDETEHTFVLPLSTNDMEQIRSIEEQKPGFVEKSHFGRGSESLVDESVRKSLQVDADHVTFSTGTAAWFHSTVEQICGELECHFGITKKEYNRYPGYRTQRAKTLKAVPYKVLMYEEGGLFTTHTDTEKQAESGVHVGTLSLVLPSRFTGGEWHFGPWQKGFGEERTETVTATQEFSRIPWTDTPANPTKLAWAAWYNDVPHSVLPVQSGIRLCLVYNLVVITSEATLEAARFDDLPIAEVAALMENEWVPNAALLDEEDDSPLAVVDLAFEYSRAAIESGGIHILKPQDRRFAETLSLAVNRLVKNVAGASSLLVVLARVDTELETFGRRWGDFDEDESGTSMEFNDLLLVGGTFDNDVLRLLPELQFNTRSCSGVGRQISSGQLTVWPDDSDCDEERRMMGARLVEEPQTYGNDPAEGRYLRKGMVLLVGPPDILCEKDVKSSSRSEEDSHSPRNTI